MNVEQIKAPTMIVHGRADRILPFENSLELAARIPRSRLFLLGGLGHLIPMERPDLFNSLTGAFWWGIEANAS
jgi:2-hydroxy-6-oxonona-2,4-dienedioate hydrolase